MSWLTTRIHEGIVEIRVRVQPGASRTEIAGLHGDRLKVRIRAKPIEGAANEAALEFLAKAAQVPRSRVEMVRGGKSREKDFRIHTPSPEKTASTIAGLAGLDTES